MKVLQNRPVTILIVFITMFIVGVYAVLRIPSTEGFNPTDDGVILAQSYRILNGEIPHRDFISIRPAGSAVMHMIHFFSPLPLEISARWLVLIEYLIYSILITFLLTGSWFKGLRKAYYLLLVSGSVVVMFILNQNHYNLFPWTTIDGLFWFSFALFAWYKLKIHPTGKHLRWQILILFAVTCSLLCRQTFALPGGLLALRMIIWEIRLKQQHWLRVLCSLLPAMIIGLLPGWLYAVVLTFTGTWPDFIQQMTGRTELWETGMIRFSHAFWHSPVLILFGVAIVSGLIKTWNTESGKDNYRIDMIIMVQKSVSFFIKIVLVFVVFIKPALLFTISFTFFWILILDVFLIYLHDRQFSRWTRPTFWILLIAWTSAISLGDNAPVFVLGWLAGTAILMQIKDFWNRIYRNVRPYQLIAAGLLIPSLFVLSLVVQPRVNYRDLPAKQLTCQGGNIFPGLAGVRISPAMSEYLSEIKKLYNEFGSPQRRFAVWPNNALIYPLLGIKNPFLLDWMQAAEYVGNEKRVIKSTRNILEKQDLIILVEKVNVKWIATERVPVDSRSADYLYLQLLDTLARQVNAESTWFKVYHTK
ncbi:MAG: hypothetical protein D4R64_06705 [Porphyromonadaceae bacterium]|nr:MAG: hypothetical protein D4R64_06705 [Porphyromonadaceae bacterium]